MSIEQKLSHDWFIHADDKNKRLYISREKLNPSGVLSPCNISPDDVDYEMRKGKNKNSFTSSLFTSSLFTLLFRNLSIR